MIRISLRSWTYTGVMMKGASMHRGITHIARHSLPPRPLMLSAIRSASTSRLPHTLWTPEQEFRPKHKDPFIVKIGQQIEVSLSLSIYLSLSHVLFCRPQEIYRRRSQERRSTRSLLSFSAPPSSPSTS